MPIFYNEFSCNSLTEFFNPTLFEYDYSRKKTKQPTCSVTKAFSKELSLTIILKESRKNGIAKTAATKKYQQNLPNSRNRQYYINYLTNGKDQHYYKIYFSNNKYFNTNYKFLSMKYTNIWY